MPEFWPKCAIRKGLPTGAGLPFFHARAGLIVGIAWGLLLVAGLANHVPAADPQQTVATNPSVASPLSPTDSLQHFALVEGLAIELAAAEPQVIDPVAIRFDEHGRMWVIEMRDYPTGPIGEQPPQSRIVVLTDEDRDGLFEKSQVFADQLVFPTGLQPWGENGVFVTLSGKIAYLQDTNHDGRADVHTTWYSGFAEQNTQLRANHPRLGIDGWIYVANGLKGGRIINERQAAAAKQKGEPAPAEIVINGMDFRFHPVTGACEAITGNGQFGMTFDDYGHRFVCSNRNPLEHVVWENWQLARVPEVPIAKVMNSVASAGEQSQVFPLSRAWTTSNLHAGQFTAACGCFIFRGDGLDARFRNNPATQQFSAFVCDPTANLVHWEVVHLDDGTFIAHPPLVGEDFLASPDEWFRPVNLETGPDGALYVVDMYRAVIEHPDWVPAELKNRPDERFGNDRGRIYRIVAKDHLPVAQSKARPLPDFALAGKDIPQRAAILVKRMESPNGWERDTVARLLWQDEAMRQAAEPLLRKKLTDRPLDAFVAQTRELIRPVQMNENKQQATDRADLWSDWQVSIDKADAHILRRVGAELAQQPRDNAAAVVLPNRYYAEELGETSFQALLLPNDAKSAEKFQELFTIAAKTGNDPWYRQAILMATIHTADAFLLFALQQDHQLPEALLGDLALAAGQHGTNQAAGDILQQLTNRGSEQQHSTLVCAAQLAAGLAKRQQHFDKVVANNPQLGTPLFDLAAKIAGSSEESNENRLAAVHLLAYSAAHAPTLQKIWSDKPDLALQLALLAAFDRVLGDAAWGSLLDDLPQQSPQIKQVLLQGTVRSPARVALLLDRLESSKFRISEIDPLMMERLRNVKDATQQARARKLLAAAIPADRAQALAEYQAALNLAGDPAAGKIVFQRNCASCHHVDDQGVNVAPDISDTRTKSPAQLLTDILQPNRAIDANFVAYAVALNDGSVQNGILSAETATSITLRQPGDKTLVLLRSEIEDLRSSGVSLMPEGLERNISQQQMADLLSYLKNWRYLDGKTPLSPMASP